ncbi:MAG: endonuclease III [Acidobacteria bacterium]|nr:endonuclease III [Acidobacteriota bacterium]
MSRIGDLTREKERRRIAEILLRLQAEYPDATCALRHRNAYELLVATILSAQCTDERVNKVTPEVFKRYPSSRTLAQAKPSELEGLIRSTGFFRNKARNLIAAAQKLVRQFKGRIPRRMDDLLELPGVARKTANVVLGTAFRIPSGIVVDTHVSRVAQRLGLTAQTQPEKIERDLMEKIPQDQWIDFSHRLIHHGRRICRARRPQHDQCVLLDLCPYYQELQADKPHAPTL